MHGLHHPPVVVHVPTIECECMSDNREACVVTPSHVRELAGACELISNVHGLHAGFEYKSIVHWSLGDEQATQQFDMVFSASSDSYDVRVSLGIFRRFGTGGAFVFDVNVLDMYPGLAEEEALIGSRQYRSSFNTLRISFVDNHLRPHTSHTDQTKNARNKRTGTMDVGKRAGVSIRMEPRDGATLVSGATIPVSISVHNKAASTCQDLEVRITMVGESAHLQLQRRLLLVPPWDL